MASKQNSPKCKFNTPAFRVSYASVFTPKVQDFNGRTTSFYQLDALFPKDSTDIEVLEEAIQAAAKDKWGAKAEKVMAKPSFKIPLKDGDEHENEQYHGSWYITLKADGEKEAPGVLSTKKDANGKFISCSQKDFYSGCWARANVEVSAFDHDVNKGISFWYKGLQKLRDDEQFGGSNFNAEESFGDISEEYEDNFGNEDSSQEETLDW